MHYDIVHSPISQAEIVEVENAGTLSDEFIKDVLGGTDTVIVRSPTGQTAIVINWDQA